MKRLRFSPGNAGHGGGETKGAELGLGLGIERPRRVFGKGEPRLDYLGRHTAYSHLHGTGEWKKVPYLKENEGELPPYMIVVGDRRRVIEAIGVLELADAVLLHTSAENMLGHVASGRVNMVLGTFARQGLKMPIAIVETQMGVPATQINLREVFAHMSFDGYVLGGSETKADRAYVIRAGTAGGINGWERKVVRVGDLVNATFGIGNCGAVIQSIGGLNILDPETVGEFRRRWIALGHGFTQDGKFARMESSGILVDAIEAAAGAAGVTAHKGGNFTKDSLYVEPDQKDEKDERTVREFVDLNIKYGVLSTEMEYTTLGELKGKLGERGFRLETGLVSGIVGVLPGESFASDPAEQARAAKVEEHILTVSAEALFWVFEQNAHRWI